MTSWLGCSTLMSFAITYFIFEFPSQSLIRFLEVHIFKRDVVKRVGMFAHKPARDTFFFCHLEASDLVCFNALRCQIRILAMLAVKKPILSLLHRHDVARLRSVGFSFEAVTPPPIGRKKHARHFFRFVSQCVSNSHFSLFLHEHVFGFIGFLKVDVHIVDVSANVPFDVFLGEFQSEFLIGHHIFVSVPSPLLICRVNQ